MFNIISKELDVNGNIREILDKCFENENKRRKILENESDSQFKAYGNINQEDTEKDYNTKLSKLSNHEKIKELNHNNVMMDFDDTSLYPPAMWDEESLYLKSENGFAFKPQMNDVYEEAFNSQTYNEDGNKKALLRTNYHNPLNFFPNIFL